MNPVCQTLLTDVARIKKSLLDEATLTSMRALHWRVMDYADSLTPKSRGRDLVEDFEEAMNELTETADQLDEICDAIELAEEDDSREEALEEAEENLAAVSDALQGIEPLSQYIETTDEIVATRWARELAQLKSIPAGKRQAALDALMDQTRTPKECSILLGFAEEAMQGQTS